MSAPKKIGIVGAGTMGSGIAQKVAQSGLQVILLDVKETFVETGLGRIRDMLEQGVKRRILRQGDPEKILGRISGTTQAADLKECDLIVEAVFEDLEIKQNLFKELEKHVRQDTVLATNTSSYKVEMVALGAIHPERFIGLHYFYHPAKNRLLEVIPSAKTSTSTLASAWAFAEATNKTAIHSEDAPGFVVNRFFVPWLNEAVRLLEEGVADIDTIEETNKRLLGIGMGPFGVMNITGVPIALHAAKGLAQEFGSFYAPADLLQKQVDSGKDWDLGGDASNRGVAEVEQRIIGMALLLGSTLVEEGVSTREDTDIGAKVGLLWAKGPFALANEQGIETAVQAAQAVAGKYGLPLPKSLVARKNNPEPFLLKAVNLNIEQGIARITMNRPEVLNALDPETVGSLETAFDAAEQDPNVKAIIIEGRGKAFVAGADIKFFLNALDDSDIPRIVSFTEKGQTLLMRIDNSKKPVVARVGGMALGGGAELALACDAIVADEGAVLGFPETGIGIYPGLGGTQRLVKRCGLGVARYLILGGDMVPAAKAAALGLVDRVTSAGDSRTAISEMLDKGLIKAGPGTSDVAQAKEAKQPYEALFTDDNTNALLKGTFEPSDELGEKVKKKLSQKAPIALRTANDLMSRAAALPIEKGIALELQSLTEIFSTEDARQGLESVGKKRPEFKGR